MAGNVKRAMGIAVQSAQGTPATTPIWLRYLEKRSWDSNTNYDTPKYERAVRWMEGDAIPTTRHFSASLDLRVDPREFPRLLRAFAAYTYTTNTHTYDFAASGLAFLTVWFWNGITGEMWRAIDVRGDKLGMKNDYTSGTIKATATLLGLGVTQLTSSLPTVSFPTYAERDPFAAWQTPVLRNGSAFCLIMGDLNLDNHLSELYCSPTADPSVGDLPGLAPTEIQEGEASGTWSMDARYTGLTGTPYEDYLLNADAAYQIKATNPNAVATQTMTWTLPRFKGTKGTLDSDPAKVNIIQQVSGSLLLDDVTATGAKAVFVNDQTTY